MGIVFVIYRPCLKRAYRYQNAGERKGLESKGEESEVKKRRSGEEQRKNEEMKRGGDRGRTNEGGDEKGEVKKNRRGGMRGGD